MYSVREQIEFGCWENAPIEEIQAITRILSTCSSKAVEFSWVKKTHAGCEPAKGSAVEVESKYDVYVASEATAVNVPCVEKNRARAGQAGDHALSSIREASLDICGSSVIHRLDTTPAVSSIVQPSYCPVTPLVGGVTGHSIERTGAITNLASTHAAAHSVPAAYYGYANSGLMPVMHHMQLVATPPVYYALPRNFNYNINMSACGIVSQPVQAAPYAYHSTVLPTGLPSNPLGSVLPENSLAPASHPSLLNASLPAGMTNVMVPTVYPTAASCSIPVQMDIGSSAASSALYPVDLAIMPITAEQATPVLRGHNRTTEHDDISFQQRDADSAVVEVDKLCTRSVNAVANENAVGLSEHPWSANLSKNSGNIPVSFCFGDGIDELLRNEVSVNAGVCSSESKTVARSVSERNKQEVLSCTLPDVKAHNEDVPRVSASCETHFNDNASCPPHTTDMDSSVTNISKMTETSISATSSPHITASELSPTTANDNASSQKSWASLFKGRSSNNQVSHTAAANSAVDNGVQQTAVVNGNGIGSAQLSLGEMLHAWHPAHKPVSLVPRGLVNRTNWCYVNAILQSLLACPPFYNLMKDVARLCDTTHAVLHPITESLVDFIGEFSPVTARAHDRRSSRHVVDLSVGSNLEASSIFRMLETSKYAAMFKQGRQEDAEEFLSYILNGLHDEMVADIQAYFQYSSSTDRLQPNGTVESGVNGTADDWEQVGPRNKATLTRTVDSSISPVSTIFQGQIRSIVSQAGGRDSSTLQPFFTLQLDIQPEGIRSINDALAKFVSRETLEGFTCSKTKQEVSANRRVLLELLPPVIILHLKCFVYNKDGCQKLFKDIDFDVDLELSKDLFSPMSRSKYAAPASRKYKLFAVLNHYGQRAVGGHYSTDYYHAAINGWVRADDGLIRHVSQDEVTRRPSQCMPYLLFYRRLESQ